MFIRSRRASAPPPPLPTTLNIPTRTESLIRRGCELQKEVKEWACGSSSSPLFSRCHCGTPPCRSVNLIPSHRGSGGTRRRSRPGLTRTPVPDGGGERNGISCGSHRALREVPGMDGLGAAHAGTCRFGGCRKPAVLGGGEGVVEGFAGEQEAA